MDMLVSRERREGHDDQTMPSVVSFERGAAGAIDKLQAAGGRNDLGVCKTPRCFPRVTKREGASAVRTFESKSKSYRSTFLLDLRPFLLFSLSSDEPSSSSNSPLSGRQICSS